MLIHSKPILQIILLALLLITVAACGATDELPTTVVATVPPGVTPTPTLAPTPTEAVVNLHMWMPVSLAPNDTPGGDVLNAQLEEFDVQHADATIHITPKMERGRGGLLDLLRTASPVAPGYLPDVIMLTDGDLAIAAREGLVQPLDALLDPATENDLFSFARSAARIDGVRIGVPLVVDFNHAVYGATRFATAPLAWSALISDSIPLLFTFANGASVSDSVMADYTWLGGAIINAESQPTLDASILTRLLTSYQSAHDANVIALSSLNFASVDDVWSSARRSNFPLSIVRASQFLAARRDDLDVSYARAPAMSNGFAPPIGRSWNLALVTRDPRRQELAVRLIEHLSAPESLAAWTQTQGVLPASLAAFDQWVGADDYIEFARSELNRAQAPPSPAAIEAVSPAFLTAIRDVINGRVTPAAAAAAAVDTVTRSD
jgi:ABC-type glycerol-3-phosphate transport system substrate-binding protein